MAYDFVSLHNHTDHGSILDGFAKPREYIHKAKELGQSGIGISDHGTLFAIYDFLEAGKEFDINVIPGCEFYVAPQNPDGAKRLSPVFYREDGADKNGKDVSSGGAYLHMTIWAYNRKGLHNLFKLSTLSNDPSRFYYKPRIDFDLLVEHSEGLIVATGCPSSEISTRFRLGQDKEAYDYARRLKEVFGDNLYVEIMNHNMSIDLEKQLLPKQLELSKKLEIPLLATNDSHYANETDHFAHEEILCSQSGSVMSDQVYEKGGSRFAFNGNEYYMKTTAQMQELFPEEDFPNALKSTLVIAEKAQDVQLEFNDNLKPKPFIPEEFGDDDFAYYQFLLDKGFKERYHSGIPADIRERAVRQLEYETQVIHSSDFVGYMLVVTDYLNHTRDSHSVRDKFGNILASPLGPGRGSVGGSITAFVLYISDIEPLRHGLIFERFLSAGRGNTYEICYNNGEREEIIVSDIKKVEGKEKYIHQLKVGDIIEEM